LNHEHAYEADPMKTANQLKIIQQRRKALARERAEVERKIALIDQEESDLAISERTLARLLGVSLDPDLEDLSQLRKRPKGGKPRDIPSIHEMALVLYGDTKQEWLETQEIVRLIKQKWWPSAKRNDIAPTLWRLHKDGKLRKDGTRYALPETQEPHHG
jgi:hypothetical protein